ncbi:MAG: D-aminoacyl-tRNA deacylase [Actinomycetota bacterium]
MRAVVQRVAEANVTVDGEVVGSIGPGLCVLLAATHGDTEREAVKIAGRLAKLRIFSDAEGKMNRSVIDTGGAVLVVSQFTLYGDTSSGNRPGYSNAARPEVAEPLIERAVQELRDLGVEAATGRFRADMNVRLVNQGPVTLTLDVDAPAG